MPRYSPSSATRILTFVSLVVLCALSFAVVYGTNKIVIADTPSQDPLFAFPNANLPHQRRALHHLKFKRASSSISLTSASTSSPAPSTSASSKSSSSNTSPTSSTPTITSSTASSSSSASSSSTRRPSDTTSSTSPTSTSTSTSSPSSTSSSETDRSSSTSVTSSTSSNRYVRHFLQRRVIANDTTAHLPPPPQLNPLMAHRRHVSLQLLRSEERRVGKECR